MQDTASLQVTQTASTSAAQARKVLTYVENERTGGKIPVWKTVRGPVPAASARGAVEANLSRAQAATPHGEQEHSFAQALVAADRDVAPVGAPAAEAAFSGGESFGFDDLLDIVNPLQHIPLVNQAYRGLTGDTIKPSSQMVGGAIFTGPLGLVMPLVDLVSQAETGSSLLGNVSSALLGGGNDVSADSAIQSAEAIASDDSRETALDQAVVGLSARVRDFDAILSDITGKAAQPRTLDDILNDHTGDGHEKKGDQLAAQDEDFQRVLLRYSTL